VALVSSDRPSGQKYGVGGTNAVASSGTKESWLARLRPRQARFKQRKCCAAALPRNVRVAKALQRRSRAETKDHQNFNDSRETISVLGRSTPGVFGRSTPCTRVFERKTNIAKSAKIHHIYAKCRHILRCDRFISPSMYMRIV